MSSATYTHLTGVKRWETFSMNPRTEEEIERELINNPDNVCVSYVCTRSHMSCEFIEKLLVISTRFVNKHTTEEDYNNIEKLIKFKYLLNEETDDIVVQVHEEKKKGEWVVRDASLKELGLDCIKDTNVTLALHNSDGHLVDVNIRDVNDRVDWKSISMSQKLDRWFIEKYAKYLDRSSILSRKDLNTEDTKLVKEKLKDDTSKGTYQTKEERKLKSEQLLREWMNQFRIKNTQIEE